MAIDPNIKKKADDIRNKIYGKEVRESLASGLEEMSSDVVENEGRQSVVESRQDSVESQWQAVSDEMTDKDVISAPEIIAARNGEANLKTRIDKDHQEVTAQLVETMTKLSPKFSLFGGQLERLKTELTNPLNQYLGISFIGDSITWGLRATGNIAGFDSGRDGTLSDIRDLSTSKSFVNLFKSYVETNYALDSIKTVSNWPSSSNGESTVQFERTIDLYPGTTPFKVEKNGTMLEDRIADGQSLLGYYFKFRKTVGYEGDGVLSFDFTGNELTILYHGLPNTMDYELFVDGVSQGVFQTSSSTSTYNVSRKHTFSYVRNKKVEIKALEHDRTALAQELRLASIRINKKVRVKNQGIIGTNSYVYKSRNMSGGDVALDEKDQFIFTMLGTNDRLKNSSYAQGANQFVTNLEVLVTDIESYGEPILMVANPVEQETGGNYTFSMQDARNGVYGLAKLKTIDFIDNNSIFYGYDTTEFTADGIHPNDFGHAKIFENIVSAVDSN